MNLEFKQFDPSQLVKQPFTGIVSSKRNSGKSVLIRDLCYKVLAGHFAYVLVFSDTLFNGFYQRFVNEKCLWDRFDPTIVSRLLVRQQEAIKKKWINSNVLVIIDDSSRNDLKDECITKLFTQGRHYNISVILSIQRSVSFVNPTIRANCDFVFLLQQPGYKAQKEVVEEYLDVFEGTDHLMKGISVLRDFTEDYGLTTLFHSIPFYSL